MMIAKQSETLMEITKILLEEKKKSLQQVYEKGLRAKIYGVIRRECEQTWTRVRVKYYNYQSTTEERQEIGT